MRWILVFLFLYLIPLVILFRNYKNLKRSYIYSSIYIVLVTTIVATNMYMSGLNKIKEAIYYYGYVQDEPYENRKTEFTLREEEKPQEVYNNESEKNVQAKEEPKDKEDEKVEEPKDNNKEIKDVNKENENKSYKKSDKEIINNFKSEIYEIEKRALIPMRECMPYTKNIAESIKKLPTIHKDLEYAKEKCREVIVLYENIDIPNLSDEQYTSVLNNARDDVKKAYELREKAMDSSITLVQSKNPKHINNITEYLRLSDKHIAIFKDRIDTLKNNVK